MENALAVEVYRWMGSWRPELMPMATYLFDLPDPFEVQERLILISQLLR